MDFSGPDVVLLLISCIAFVLCIAFEVQILVKFHAHEPKFNSETRGGGRQV